MYFLKYDKLIVLIYVKMISNGGYNMHYKAVKGILSNDNTISNDKRIKSKEKALKICISKD